MATKYGYQATLAGVPTAMLYVEGQTITASPVANLPAATPAQVRAGIEAARAWFRTVRTLEFHPEGAPDFPFECSVKTVGNSGKISLTFQAGQLKRTAAYDPQTKAIKTDDSPGFSCSVWSWLRMHDAYLTLCRIAEGGAG